MSTQFVVDSKLPPSNASGEPVKWVDLKKDFYATIRWSDIPKEDWRRLWFGWLGNWQYANAILIHPWSSAISAPKNLTLRNTAKGLKLIQYPLRKLIKLWDKEVAYHELERVQDTRMFLGSKLSDNRPEIIALIGSVTAPKVGFRLRKGKDEASLSS